MDSNKSSDTFFMKRALTLAKKGKGWTNPNPMVGTVIVKKRKIIAQKYHTKSGQSHAEVNAFNNAKEKTNGATLYVTLEPCNHFGKTPPCTESIIRAGITKVICCAVDPNPLVSG